jgi:hypothetical protein
VKFPSARGDRTSDDNNEWRSRHSQVTQPMCGSET